MKEDRDQRGEDGLGAGGAGGRGWIHRCYLMVSPVKVW